MEMVQLSSPDRIAAHLGCQPRCAGLKHFRADVVANVWQVPTGAARRARVESALKALRLGPDRDSSTTSFGAGRAV